ncbi:MAG: TIGR00300 family protein [Actinomycetota bacterium]|nr:TIGR00300 family protein [Actinomycetota bacterium]
MKATETVEMQGHIVDSLTLAKVLDIVVGAGAEYTLDEVELGRTSSDPSRGRRSITADDDVALATLLDQIHLHGANRVSAGDAVLAVSEKDGVLPAGFYSTTNLPTSVRLAGRWRPVERPEMDCAVVVDDSGTARTVPMHRVRSGDRVVTGSDGIRVEMPVRAARGHAFEFMTSEVSSEKPQALLVAEVCRRAAENREAGGRLLAVCGPAVVHTGAGPDLARLVRNGWVDVLFAGNGFATHDIESNVMGTSLGVSLGEGTAAEGGHANHLRVINEVRRHGSIAGAVRAGFLGGGVLYECVRRDVPFVLAGSIRDDGPLPDVVTDVVAAADAMRDQLEGVGVALMLASTLHGIATGNLLPAGVQTFCVDINQAVAIKLSDRGTHQALGIVTDVGLFLRQMADRLCRDA